MKPGAAVGQLPFMDDEPGVDGFAFERTFEDSVDDLVERDDDVSEVGTQAETQCQIGRGERAGNGNGLVLQIVNRPGLFRDDPRPVAVSHAGPATAKGVTVGQMGVGMDADRGQFEFGVKRAAIERFDVDQFVHESIRTSVDLLVRQGVEHKGVVRIGAVPDVDRDGWFHANAVLYLRPVNPLSAK